MYVPSLEIRNFRGFQQVGFEEFSNLNFIFGKNNCGKTSVLEAIFGAVGSDPQWLFIERGLNLPEKTDDFLHLFYSSQIENNPCINWGNYQTRIEVNKDILAMKRFYKNNLLEKKHISFVDRKLKVEYYLNEDPDIPRSMDQRLLIKFVHLGLHNEEFDKGGINAILDDNNDAFITQVLNQIDPAITGWADWHGRHDKS